jgi:branched-chain amino acid transport system permease protein
LGGVETVSGAVVGAIVYKSLAIWLMSETEMSKLVLGAVIVAIVVLSPKGIVGYLSDFEQRMAWPAARSKKA